MTTVKTETLPPFDYYADSAVFFEDGSVDVVSYKGEEERSFDTVEDFEDWKAYTFKKYF